MKWLSTVCYPSWGTKVDWTTCKNQNPVTDFQIETTFDNLCKKKCSRNLLLHGCDTHNHDDLSCDCHCSPTTQSFNVDNDCYCLHCCSSSFPLQPQHWLWTKSLLQLLVSCMLKPCCIHQFSQTSHLLHPFLMPNIFIKLPLAETQHLRTRNLPGRVMLITWPCCLVILIPVTNPQEEDCPHNTTYFTFYYKKLEN